MCANILTMPTIGGNIFCVVIPDQIPTIHIILILWSASRFFATKPKYFLNERGEAMRPQAMRPHKNANGKTACCIDPNAGVLEVVDKNYKVKVEFEPKDKVFTLTNYDLAGNVTEVKRYTANA